MNIYEKFGLGLMLVSVFGWIIIEDTAPVIGLGILIALFGLGVSVFISSGNDA